MITEPRATVTLRARGRFPESKIQLSVERTAFFRGFATAIGVNTVQEACDARLRR
jgi:hypothetical protein